jgi:hypothetical protein
MTNRQALNLHLTNDSDVIKSVMMLRVKRSRLVKRMESKTLAQKIEAYSAFDNAIFQVQK